MNKRPDFTSPLVSAQHLLSHCSQYIMQHVTVTRIKLHLLENISFHQENFNIATDTTHMHKNLSEVMQLYILIQP